MNKKITIIHIFMCHHYTLLFMFYYDIIMMVHIVFAN